MSDDTFAKTPFPVTRGWRRLAVAGCLATFLGSLALPAAPATAWTEPPAAGTEPPPTVTRPDVTTGPAQSVSDGSATLTGLVNPQGSDTSYYFQYGPTTAYGAQTATVAAGDGVRAVRVAVSVKGLRPLTIYHFRLVAVNAAGAQAGVDRAFKTARVPPPPPPIRRAATPALPGVNTGGAEAVSFGSATLTGSINPHGSNTSYYFQYGPTRAYGAQTAVADAGAGVGTVVVRVPVSGLQPVTIYHFRLIAVNAAGARTGSDRAFRTAKVPLSLQILASPNPALYGGAVTIQGTLSGTGNGGVPVLLQANPFPYTQGFVTVGNPELTAATGGFSFPFLGIAQATQFRVVTSTKVPVVSPVAIEGVAVRVDAHVGRTRRHRRHHARIYGTVTPAVDGMEVAIMRITGGRNVLVAGTTLHHLNATSSRFSRVIRVKRGAVYRVLVRVTNGAQTSNYSEPLFIR